MLHTHNEAHWYLRLSYYSTHFYHVIRPQRRGPLKLPLPRLFWTLLQAFLSLTTNLLSSSLTGAFPMPPNTIKSTGGRARRRGTHSDVVNIAPFTDHVGNPALSIYRGKAKPNRKQPLPTIVPSFRILTSRETPPPSESPLRHPYSFQIYITTGLTSTSPATSPLLHHLYDMIQGTSYVKEWGLAVYFLSHADKSAI